jgi:outer membrane receptor for ferrienterochelin and colicins
MHNPAAGVAKWLLLPVVLSCMAPVAVLAQTGRLVGTVTDASNNPLVAAQILIPALGLSSQSGEGGRYAITGIPSGSYLVKVLRIGYRAAAFSGVAVETAGTTTLPIRLEQSNVRLQSVVISASRHAEKVTDAAATIHAIDAVTLDARIGNSYTLGLRNTPGLDVTQVGVTSVFVNGRGFNNRFNTRWLTLEDGRIAALAETGLPIGEHTTIPKIDVASMEVLTGPGSALYGANASNGMLAVRTRDARDDPGFTLEVAGGTRSLYDVQGRYAGSNGRIAYKVAGEGLAAKDFSNVIKYPPVTAGGSALPETITDWNTNVSRLSGALVYQLSDATRFQLNTGTSRRNGVGDSNSGHYQIDNYQYSDYQLMFSSPRWLAQTYLTHSNTGDTYQIYLAVPTMARNPSLSLDSVRKATKFHVDGRIYVAEVHNNFLVSMLARTGLSAFDNSLITWGVQRKHLRVSSYGTIYSDVLTGKPIHLDNDGVFAQIETPFTPQLRAVVAARHDRATRYAPQTSPRVSLLYSPAADQSVRLTYGEAYRSPPILTTDLYNVASPTVRNIGNRNGFVVKDSLGNVVNTIGQLVPETNHAWELGYKAVLKQRLYTDITFWHSKFVNFISGGFVVADPFVGAKTRAYNPETGQLYADAKR